MAGFTIKIVESDPGTFRISASSEIGAAESDRKVIPAEFVDAITIFKNEIIRCNATRRARAAVNVGNEAGDEVTLEHLPLPSRADSRITKELGSRLFKFVFDSNIEPLYRQCDTKALTAGEALPIKLCIESTSLAPMPWEIMFDKEWNRYLSTSQHTRLSRGINAPVVPVPKPKNSPIEVAGMIADPGNFADFTLDPINATLEMDELENALKGKGNVRWTTTGRQLDLERLLLKRKAWDVFHFIGHGGHDPDAGGFLFVQEEDGADADVLYADVLTGILNLAGGGPRLVVLNSCEGALELPTQELFSSTAAALLRGGIPAVVAMQFPIRDAFAVQFCKLFYSYLPAGIPIEHAVALARNTLLPKWSEWMAPVAYVRNPDTTLFE